LISILPFNWLIDSMTRDKWLLTALALLCACNAGTVWLAQVSGYPLWPLVGKGEFSRYYTAWSNSGIFLITKSGTQLRRELACKGLAAVAHGCMRHLWHEPDLDGADALLQGLAVYR
jgi:hypothetical protein